ncbi:hypothetical protein K2X30_12360 [bacterium]|jgi:hypothetical protein|nr:hypothetical protein [bacterium]
MLRQFALVAVLGSLSSLAQASPILYEKETMNFAWGKVHHGCVIDHNGVVYTYDMAKKQNITATAVTLSKTELDQAHKLLYAASKGKYTEKHVMADAGSVTWTGYWGDETVTLKKWGDLTGQNSAKEAAELADLLDKYCQ